MRNGQKVGKGDKLGRGTTSARNRNERRASEKVGWRILEWSHGVGCGKSTTNELIRDKKIASVKLGGARIITTSPSDYLDRLAAEQTERAAG